MGIDAIGFVMEIERTFGIEIPEDDYSTLPTVGSVCEYIVRRVPQSDPDHVWKTVRAIASEEFQIPRDEIQPESRWIEDLKID